MKQLGEARRKVKPHGSNQHKLSRQPRPTQTERHGRLAAHSPQPRIYRPAVCQITGEAQRQQRVDGQEVIVIQRVGAQKHALQKQRPQRANNRRHAPAEADQRRHPSHGRDADELLDGVDGQIANAQPPQQSVRLEHAGIGLRVKLRPRQRRLQIDHRQPQQTGVEEDAQPPIQRRQIVQPPVAARTHRSRTSTVEHRSREIEKQSSDGAPNDSRQTPE